jgi:hypothetical protein
MCIYVGVVWGYVGFVWGYFGFVWGTYIGFVWGYFGSRGRVLSGILGCGKGSEIIVLGCRELGEILGCRRLGSRKYGVLSWLKGFGSGRSSQMEVKGGRRLT